MVSYRSRKVVILPNNAIIDFKSTNDYSPTDYTDMFTQICINLLFIFYAMAEMGPADISVLYVEKCPNKPDVELKWYIQHRKYNRTFPTISFNATLPYEFSDDLTISISVSSRSNGAWKPNFYNFNFKGLCRSLKEYKYTIFRNIAKSRNAKPQCPLPKGVYKLDNLDYVSETMKMPSTVMPYGEFKVDALVYNEHHKLAACVNVYLEITPMKKKRKTKQ